MDESLAPRFEPASRQLAAIAAALDTPLPGEGRIETDGKPGTIEHRVVDQFGLPDYFYAWEADELRETPGWQTLEARCRELGITPELVAVPTGMLRDSELPPTPDLHYLTLRLSGR
jgi:hypothetical protein